MRRHNAWDVSFYGERAKVEANHSLGIFITVCAWCKGAKLSFYPGASHDRFGLKFRSVKFHVSHIFHGTTHIYDSTSLNTPLIYFYNCYIHTRTRISQACRFAWKFQRRQNLTVQVCQGVSFTK